MSWGSGWSCSMMWWCTMVDSSESNRKDASMVRPANMAGNQNLNPRASRQDQEHQVKIHWLAILAIMGESRACRPPFAAYVGFRDDLLRQGRGLRVEA